MAYEFEYILEEYLDSGAFALNLMRLYNVFGTLFSIATYVLTALGLYTIAKRRGIRNSWLAWVPVVSCWIIGCISDQYRYVVRGQVKSKRKALLTLNIVQAVLVIVMGVMAVMLAANAVTGAMNYVSEEQMMESLMTPVVAILLLCIPMMGVAIAICVIRYMAMYDLYTSCAPYNNVMFLVLSIIFNVTEPFFVFFNRNKDKGMPPRRVQEPAYIPEEPRYTEPREPWDNCNE